jgi:cytochrome P450
MAMPDTVDLAERFDPQDPAFVRDATQVYADLRERAPVLYHERTDHWLVSRHQDVVAALTDRRFGRTYRHRFTHQEMGRPDPPAWHDPFWWLIEHGILDMEPPDHTRVRRLVSKAFTPRMVDALRPKVGEITEALLDRVQGSGTAGFDLIAEVAEPLPVTVIAEMLGVPEADRHLLRPWSADICLMYELHPSLEEQRRSVRASEGFTGYLRALAAERRERPGEDLISALARVVDEGERLTEGELVGTCVLLLNAGHEATVNATGLSWWSLFHHPDQLARLRADPGLIPRAIEELLRFESPLPMFERWVLDDVEVGGIRIPRGAELGLLYASANRDPAAFDRPDALDLGRDPNPHLTFGHGIHFCLGAPLARVELATTFEALLRRMPRLELAQEPSFKPSYVLRGLRERGAAADRVTS